MAIEDKLLRRLDDYLKAKDLKQTKQRVDILSEMVKMPNHFSAEEVHQRLQAVNTGIGLATIYRTLNLFKDADIINEHQFADGKSVYEIHDPSQHHDHLICMRCQMIVEFHDEQIEALQKSVASKAGFQLICHRHALFGVCPKCA